MAFQFPLLINEVNTSDLIIIEGIKTFFPELYHFIRGHPEYFTVNYSNLASYPISKMPVDKEKVKIEITKKLEVYSEDLSKKILLMLMDLFPQLRSIYQNYHYTDEYFEQWYREQRLCSPHYIERYFSYVVRKGDIPDTYFKQLIFDLNSVSVKELTKRFENELPKHSAGNFLFKLQRYIDGIDAPGLSTLAITLSQLGSYFSSQKGELFFGPKDHSTFLIQRILQKLPAEKRFDTCFEVLTASQPLSYTMNLYYRMREKPNRPSELRLLTIEEENKIEQYIVERAIEEYKDKNVFELLPDHETAIVLEMFVKAGKKNDAQKMLFDQLEADSKNSLAIIKIFTPTVHSTAVPYPYKANFNETAYKRLNKVIDAKRIYYATVLAFGKKEYLPVEDIQSDELTDENLIALFQKIHLESQP